MSDGIDALGRGLAGAFNGFQGEELFGITVFFLALVFLASATPKLRKPELAALALVDFGVVRQAPRSAGLALGAAESGLAIALAIAAIAHGSIARSIPVALAAVLLWSFVGLIARALRSPDRFTCFCFGSEDSTVSSRTLLRAILLAFAATVLFAASFADQSTSSPRLELLELMVAASVLGTLVVVARIPKVWGAFE